MLTVPTSSNIQKCCYKNLTSFKLDPTSSNIMQQVATGWPNVCKRGEALDPASYRSFSYARRCQLTFPSSCLITLMLDDVALKMLRAFGRALTFSRYGFQSSVNVRVVNQLLTEMDGLEARKQVFIMGATNRPGETSLLVA